MPTIDDEEYRRGRESCEAGDTLRSVLEFMWSAPAGKSEDQVMSFALGFADALIDMVRGQGS